MKRNGAAEGEGGTVPFINDSGGKRGAGWGGGSRATQTSAIHSSHRRDSSLFRFGTERIPERRPKSMTMLTPLCLLALVGPVAARSHVGGVLTSSVDGSLAPSSGRAKRAAVSGARRLVRALPPSTTKSNFLLQEHNKYRRQVPATNMQYIFWDPKLAASGSVSTVLGNR